MKLKYKSMKSSEYVDMCKNQRSFSWPALQTPLVCCGASISLQQSSFIGLQVQGEFSQFEAVWPLAMICSCHYSPLLSAPFFLRPWSGLWQEDIQGKCQDERWATGPWREIMRHAWAMRLPVKRDLLNRLGEEVAHAPLQIPRARSEQVG